MRILIYRWEAYNYKDIIQTFKSLGHTVEVLSFKLDNYDRNDEFEGILRAGLAGKSFDFVFSVNYFAIIAEVCHDLGIRYVTWSCDAPLISMFHESVLYDTNRFFIFDLAAKKTFENLGVKNIEYLPLAVNTDRLERLKAFSDDDLLYANDISFVGSLYERNYYDTVEPHLPEYLRGYFTAVLEIQSDCFAEVIIDRALTPQILAEVSEYFRLEPSSEGSFSDLGLVFSTTILGYKAAQLQRKSALIELSKHFKVGFYTGSDASDLIRVSYRGSVEYLTQMPKVFWSGGINLNFTIPNIRSGIPLRVWDIMGAGGFLLTNPQPELALFFEKDEMATFTCRSELVEKCRYYLKHESERKAMAGKAFEKVKKYHTYEVRMKEMLEAL